MPFNNVSDYADYRTEGAWQQSSYIRTSTPVVGVTGRWLDLSVGAGQPVYNAYGGSPLTATQLINDNANKGAYTGPVPGAGKTKHLHSMTVDTTSTSFPSTFVLCDYLMFYPFVDLDDISQQTMDNTASLPRYTDGESVQCFVSIQTPTNGLNINGLCTVEYTNSDGVSGRITTFNILGSTGIGSIANCGNDITTAISTHASPFIPLAIGDRGIRSIQSVTMSTGIGGLASFVLCQSIGAVPLITNLTQTEKTFFSRTGRAPRIYDGAFLHFIANNGVTSGLTMATFRSSLTFVWG
jgi:hypothetical protein